MDKTRQIEDHFDFDQSEMKQDPLQTDDGRTNDNLWQQLERYLITCTVG